MVFEVVRRWLWVVFEGGCGWCLRMVVGGV